MQRVSRHRNSVSEQVAKITKIKNMFKRKMNKYRIGSVESTEMTFVNVKSKITTCNKIKLID